MVDVTLGVWQCLLVLICCWVVVDLAVDCLDFVMPQLYAFYTTTCAIGACFARLTEHAVLQRPLDGLVSVQSP